MTKVKWQDHFKSAVHNSENLYSKDATNVSLLMFCLRSKLIPAQAYLDWARENFQTPVLSEKYFQVFKPQAEFFKKWQKLHTWSVECLPIAEWDGVLIVACLEIPENFRSKHPVTFVLTTAAVLDEAWSLYNTAPDALAATVVLSPQNSPYFGADGEVVLMDTPSEEDAPEKEDHEEAKEENEDNESPGSANESPDGLFGDAPPPSMGSLSVLKSDDIPIPLKAQKGPRTVEPLLKLKEKDTSGEPPVFEGSATLVAPVPLSAPSPAQAPSPTPAATIPTKAAPNHNDLSAYSLEKLRQQRRDGFDSEITSSFQQMKTFFKKSMLVAIADDESVAKPLLWDSGFDTKNAATPPELSLKSPSIFKIVASTQKPYHGFIVVNDLNESFFETWNHGQIPDHVTLVPLLSEDRVVGLLMGFGEKATYNKNVLQFTENIAKGLSAKIFRPAQVQKAA